jgi:hypothetical protein
VFVACHLFSRQAAALEPGRISRAKFSTTVGAIAIAGVRISTSRRYQRKRNLYLAIQRLTPAPEEAVGLLLGDWNFSTVGDFRVGAAISKLAQHRSGGAKQSEQLFDKCIRLAQDERAWRLITVYRRIDRISRTSYFLGLKPTASTMWIWASSRARTSDHLLVACVWRELDGESKKRSLPCGIASSAQCCSLVESILQQSGGAISDPTTAVAEREEAISSIKHSYPPLHYSNSFVPTPSTTTAYATT